MFSIATAIKHSLSTSLSSSSLSSTVNPSSYFNRYYNNISSSSVTNFKETTGITGINVIPNAREVLMNLLEETRKKAETYEDVPYNQTVIRLCKYRYKLCSENVDVEELEDAICSGQIEELIEQAENEYDLLIRMNEQYQPWLPDPEGDALFAATNYPSFGESGVDSMWLNWIPDDSIWKEVDEKYNLKTKNTLTTEQWEQYIKTPEGQRTELITSGKPFQPFIYQGNQKRSTNIKTN